MLLAYFCQTLMQHLKTATGSDFQLKLKEFQIITYRYNIMESMREKSKL